MFISYKKAFNIIFLSLITINLYAKSPYNPTTIALSFLQKIYGPHKTKLQNKREGLEKINTTLVALEDAIINKQISDKQATLALIERKKNKIQKIVADLSDITTAVDHCPTIIKNERLQKKLANSGERYLGADSPALIKSRAQALLISIEYLENRI